MEEIENKLTFEEIMYSVIEATQETFAAYLDIELFAGKAIKTIEPIDADVVGIIGIGGKRVGYIIIALNNDTARIVTEKLTMEENPEPDLISDTTGEMINIIAGQIKSKYHAQYGKVALGLPLIMSGTIAPKGMSSENQEQRSLSVTSDSVIIPFKSFEKNIEFSVMVFM